ncbi:hypothetical protein PanWU01x14_032310, partial [Parasponia andersonii]
ENNSVNWVVFFFAGEFLEMSTIEFLMEKQFAQMSFAAAPFILAPMVSFLLLDSSFRLT